MNGPLAHPLSWPAGWGRTVHRQRARFGDWSLARACEVLLEELSRAPIRCARRDVVISTNVELRLDGLPRSNQRAPEDPGAAVYFKLARRPTVLACDRWDRCEHNLRALSLHVAALRALDRHGVGTLEQAFLGYAALPERTSSPSWWDVLGWDDPAGLTPELVRESFRCAAKILHPDVPGTGNREEFLALVEAQRQGLEALGVPT